MHALLTVALALAASAPADAAPEIWMCHRGMDELAKHPDEWAFVREHISGIQVYIDQFARYDAADMTALAELVREADLKVSVECGGLLDFGPVGPGIGAWTANTNSQRSTATSRPAASSTTSTWTAPSAA